MRHQETASWFRSEENKCHSNLSFKIYNDYNIFGLHLKNKSPKSCMQVCKVVIRFNKTLNLMLTCKHKNTVLTKVHLGLTGYVVSIIEIAEKCYECILVRNFPYL